MAGALSLPETQLYLAHNTPHGRKPAVRARSPQPKWDPKGGWRVDPALVFAHTLQDSRFQRTVVSSAGATAIGRASCRERVCQYVSISVVAVSLKKKSINNGLSTYT